MSESALARGVALHQAGRLDDAEACYQTVLGATPEHPDALHYLGLIAFQRGEYAPALARIERAIESYQCAGRPAPAEARVNLGNVLKRLGRAPDATQAYHAALALRPDFSAAWFNLALLQRADGDLSAAIGSLESACQLPDSVPAFRVELGEIHVAMGDDRAALSCFEWALAELKREADSGSFHLTLRVGRGLVAIGRHAMAVQVLDPLRARQPDDIELLNALGCAASGCGQLGVAERYLRRAHRLQPEATGAIDNLATVLKDSGRVEEAVEFYRSLIATPSGEPPGHATWSNYLFTLLYSDQQSPPDLLAEHRRAVPFFALPAGEAPLPVVPCAPPRGRPLRLAYLSGDLRNHPVAYFLSGLLREHDRQAVDVHVYDNSPASDGWSEQLRAQSPHWRAVRALTDRQLAQLIQDDRIDVLVDLSGHTADNRLAALAYRPAPVQASYLGYPFSTGLPWMDWRIVDPVTDPPGSDAFSSERLWRLPRSYYAYLPPDHWPAPNELPALRNGYLTFGVSSNLAKVSGTALDLWATLLRHWPDARLRWKARAFVDPGIRHAMQAALAERGIGKKRVRFETWAAHPERCRFYHEVDVCLDTYPYNQATNTCEALWMGVPTFSVRGWAHASRMGGSILAEAGLAEWVCDLGGADLTSPRIVEHVAPLLVPESLGALRQALRPRLQQSRLLDCRDAARSIEMACNGMYAAKFDQQPLSKDNRPVSPGAIQGTS